MATTTAPCRLTAYPTNQCAGRAKQYKKFLAEKESIYTLFKEKKKTIDKFAQAFIEWNLCVLNVAAKDFKTSLSHIKELFKLTSLNKARLLFVYAKLVEILIHYELRHFKLLPSLLNSLEHIVGKTKRGYDFERLFWELFKGVPQKGLAIYFTSYITRFEVYKDHGFFGSVDMVSWLKEKVENGG